MMSADAGPRRALLVAPLLAAMPGLLALAAHAAGPDPAMTIVKLPDEILWQTARDRSPKTVEQAPL